jgi:hypothetical protein
MKHHFKAAFNIFRLSSAESGNWRSEQYFDSILSAKYGFYRNCLSIWDIALCAKLFYDTCALMQLDQKLAAVNRFYMQIRWICRTSSKERKGRNGRF